MKSIPFLSIILVSSHAMPTMAGELFFGLGALPGDDSRSSAAALSGDGNWVAVRAT